MNKFNLRQKVVLFLGFFLLFFLLFSFTISKKVEIKHVVEISANIETIFPLVLNLDQWGKWSVWNKTYYQNLDVRYYTNRHSNVIRLETKPKTYEVSHINADFKNTDFAYDLAIEVTQINPKQEMTISYFVKDQAEPLVIANSIFKFHPMTPNKTKVTWEYLGDYQDIVGGNPLQRYYLLYTQYSLKRANLESIEGLKKFAEKNQKED